MVSIITSVHFSCSQFKYFFDRSHTSAFPIYHGNANTPCVWFFSPHAWTPSDPETSEQAKVACDRSFVIINESSVEFPIWYTYCCIACSISFNKSGISEDNVESDWQQEGSCHGSSAGPEKHCVNWSLVAEQKVAPGCHCAMYVWAALVRARGEGDCQRCKAFIPFIIVVMRILRDCSYSWCKETVWIGLQHPQTNCGILTFQSRNRWN